MIQSIRITKPKNNLTSAEVQNIFVRFWNHYALLSVIICFTAHPTWGAPDVETKKVPVREFEGVEIKDKLGAQVPLDLVFRDEAGKEVQLEKYFHKDKPILLTLVYYNCPMLCSLVLNAAIDGLRDLGWAPGDKYEAVTVSISPVEGPDLAVKKKKNYMRQLGIVGAENGWHFLTGAQPQIKALAESIGFGYRYDPSTQDYAHGAALFFLSPNGKLTRLLKGIQFEAQELRLSFVEASEGKIGSIYDRLLLRCFRYEPSSKKYAFYIWGAVRLGGIFTILGIGLLLLVMWRGERKASSSALTEDSQMTSSS